MNYRNWFRYEGEHTVLGAENGIEDNVNQQRNVSVKDESRHR
jgi:hypothetical protein